MQTRRTKPSKSRYSHSMVFGLRTVIIHLCTGMDYKEQYRKANNSGAKNTFVFKINLVPRPKWCTYIYIYIPQSIPLWFKLGVKSTFTHSFTQVLCVNLSFVTKEKKRYFSISKIHRHSVFFLDAFQNSLPPRNLPSLIQYTFDRKTKLW